MSWVRYDDSFADHPKLVGLGRDQLVGMGVHVMATCYASRHRTDGFVPKSVIERIAPPRIVARLVEAGLFEEAAGGYFIHDFLDYNPSRADREKVAAERRQAGSKGLANRWQTDSKPMAYAQERARVPGPVPSPTPVSEPPDPPDDPLTSAFALRFRRYPSKAQQAIIRDYLETFDVSGPERGTAAMLADPDDPLGALIRDLAAFRAEARDTAIREERAAKARHRKERREADRAEILQEWAKS